MTIESQIIELLNDLPYAVKMAHIKNVEAELIRLNGLNVMNRVSKFAREHPKIKEPSNSYKKGS